MFNQNYSGYLQTLDPHRGQLLAKVSLFQRLRAALLTTSQPTKIYQMVCTLSTVLNV